MPHLSNIRTGRITSGDIVALVSMGSEFRDMTPEEKAENLRLNPKSKAEKIKVEVPGAPFYNYVQECIMERFFKQRLENDVEVLAMAWGKLCENIVHNKLPNSYIFHSDETMVHPEILEWVGTPDGSKRRRVVRVKGKLIDLPFYKFETITDIKCPLTRKSFYQLVAPLYHFDGIKARKKKKSEINGLEVMNMIRFGYEQNGMRFDKHKDGEKFYWQLVSNACITGAKYAELIVFMPYREELDTVRAYNIGQKDPNFLVGNALDRQLPFIYKQSGVRSVNIIRFEVPQEDKDFLKMRVEMAIDLINK